jgi:hypothetical protein
MTEDIRFKVYGDGLYASKTEAVKNAELTSELLGLYITKVIGV